MSARLLDGDALAARTRADIAARARDTDFWRGGGRPGLVTVLVGQDPASQSYVARKHGDCEELGFASRSIWLPADVREAELLDLVASLNRDPACHGLLVQLPLPGHIDAARVQEAVAPAKDVDGLHPVNLGRMMARQPGLRPCTPQAILALLAEYRVPLAGRRVAIIGRGPLVGAPLAVVLADPVIDAVPTLLHRGSRDMAATLREADVIVAAAGVPDLVRAEHVRPGACVVGVGITYQGEEMISDIADDVAQAAGWVTPRHGSVGPMTRAMLMANLLAAALGSGLVAG
jgi:methylenetetrahydrofolate dehydrogenase (NADP+) / methenyltetrahydrofolate cyclohydrolase